MKKITKKLIKRRQELLNDTINHYNSNNRSSSISGQCYYYPVSDKSEGCAIGRLIKDKELCKDFGCRNLSDVFEQIPNELQELGKEFLMELQNLHDLKENWNENGLSENGKEQAEFIREIYLA